MAASTDNNSRYGLKRNKKKEQAVEVEYLLCRSEYADVNNGDLAALDLEMELGITAR